MHRCLTVDEILRHIVIYASQLHADDSSPLIGKEWRPDCTGTETVLSFALVCKTFEQPALDRLWQRQMGFGNLIRLLPRDMWEESPAENIMIPEPDDPDNIMWSCGSALQLVRRKQLS